MAKKRKVRVNLTRGDFLTLAAAAAGSAIVAPLITSGPLSPFAGLSQEQISLEESSGGHGGSTGPYHWGMVIDLDKCIGCEYCSRACTATNDVDTDKLWNIVVKEANSYQHTFFFSRPCLHCQVAPCVEVCPVKATYVREDGLVVMDYNRCIGCRYCEVACPYDARKFNWEARKPTQQDPNNPYPDNPFVPTWGIPEVSRRLRGVVEKCTFCIHRIDKGLRDGFMPGKDPEATPACVNICPVEARIFGNLKDPESQISQIIANNPVFRLKEELGTESSVYYIPPKEGL